MGRRNDEDINFIVMTGGAWMWQLDDDTDPNNENGYLVFPADVDVPNDAVLVPDPEKEKTLKPADFNKGRISGAYNQVWEAKELVANAEKQVQTAEDALAEAQKSGDQTKITEAYANLVNAQNNLTEAQKVLATTLDSLKAEQKDELENKIDELNDQIADLNDELAKAQVVDISHYAVTMSSSAVYNGKTIAPKVTVSGLKSTVYKVTYSNNKNVGTAKVVIEAKDPAYKGKINKTFKINPKKAAIAKIKKGKKYQVQIRAFAKVGGKTYYGAWSKVKTSKKIK